MIRRVLIPTICFFASFEAHAATSIWCRVDESSSAQLVFAKFDNASLWASYKSMEIVPELSLEGGISAQVWRKESNALLVRTVEPGEDFWGYTEYCFGNSGKLMRVRYEVRTAWGWAYRVEGPFAKGSMVKKSERFISTKNDTPIPRPKEAEDISQALKPTIYPYTSRLPFSKLLSKSMDRFPTPASK